MIDAFRAALADRYRIDRELGKGGMATVYLAHDLKHDREVAIKVMHPQLGAAMGPERFQREIRVAAKLQHPHIVTVHDSGEAAGLLWYSMPYVAGESLRDRLARDKQLPINEALRIAGEISDALSYAHSRGVVHRDIKPENILLEGGHAVVTDFGIAKATDLASADSLTGTGVILGTPHYMSPEQAAGEQTLDGRSDVYSLGCVLYEMLAGQPPFTGPTVEIVVHQHLMVNAPPITNFRPAVPVGIATVLQRALAKTPADRFTPVALFTDALDRAATPSRDSIAAPNRRRMLGIGVAVLAAVVLAGVAAKMLLARHGPAVLALGKRSQVTREPGLEIDPALSPDGKLLAYSGVGRVLLVRQVEGGDPIPVIRDGGGTGRWPAWAPNGQRLFFLSPRGVEVVPALGGTPRLVAAGANTERGIAVAPDGRTVAFIAHDSLYAKPVDGGAARLITTVREMHSPAWSPDGKWIAFVSGNIQYDSADYRSLGNLAASGIQVVRANGGKSVHLTEEHFVNVSPAWTPRGELLFLSDREGSRDIYQVRLSKSGAASGSPVRLTTGLNALGIAMSLDGSRLTYSSFRETSNVWSLPIARRGLSISQALPVTVGNQTIENLDVSPDGQWLAFNSDINGVGQLYRQRIGGGPLEPQQVTADTGGSFWPVWSPDSKFIAYYAFHGQRRQVFVLPSEGGPPTPVTDGSEDVRSPEWSPDGQRLAVLANWGTRPALYIVHRTPGGGWSAPQNFPIVIGPDTLGGLGVWSPDGGLLACGCGPGGLVVVPATGGAARRLASPFSTAGWAFPQWSADGQTIFHLTEDSAGVSAVVAVPLSGARPYVAVRFDDPARPWHRFGFRVRGDRLYLTLGDQQSDIWVAAAGPAKK
jgi:Tol biopolymer transport system component/tRNA A-37 threonylcarbamoyl transferase component Bud32